MSQIWALGLNLMGHLVDSQAKVLLADRAARVQRTVIHSLSGAWCRTGGNRQASLLYHIQKYLIPLTVAQMGKVLVIC